MKFLKYINGQRRGKEAHLIEKEAMESLFLQEAIEGYDSIDSDHLVRIAQIKAKIKEKSKVRGNNRKMWLSVAASAVTIVALTTYISIDKDNQHLLAQLEPTNNSNIPINLYIPASVLDNESSILSIYIPADYDVKKKK